MSSSFPFQIALAAILLGAPAQAQTSGGIGGSAGSGGAGVGGVSGGSVAPGSGSTAIGGTNGAIGQSGSSVPGSGTSTLSDPIAPGATSGSTSLGAATTEGVASQGASTINSLNAEGLARSDGGAGTSSVTSLSTGSDQVGTPGAGSEQDYRITRPSVSVDLGAIRRGLAKGPSAIPKPNGD